MSYGVDYWRMGEDHKRLMSLWITISRLGLSGAW